MHVYPFILMNFMFFFICVYIEALRMVTFQQTLLMQCEQQNQIGTKRHQGCHVLYDLRTCLDINFTVTLYSFVGPLFVRKQGAIMMPEPHMHHGSVAWSAGQPIVVCMMHIHVVCCKSLWYNVGESLAIFPYMLLYTSF